MKFRITLILIFFINYIASGSDWLLVEGFDNTPTFSKSEVQTINCLDSNNCYAIVQHATMEDYGSRIFNSSNGGRLWELINSTKHEFPWITNVKEGVSPYPGYYYLISDDDSFLEKSTDGGKTFKTIILDDSGDFVPPGWPLDDFAMYDTNRGFVTNGFEYFTTTDGWETFEKHPKKNNDETFYSPQFIDSNTIIMAYASNFNPEGMAVVKYRFGEDKLDTLAYLGFNSGSDQTDDDFKRIYCIYFVNDSLGFGSGSSRVHQGKSEYFDMVYRTTDGGYTWETVLRQIKYPEVGLVYDITFADENNGVAVGYYGKIAMTNDGGKTWVYEPIPVAMDDALQMLVCWAGHTPLIGTWNGGIFRYEGDFFKFPISVKEILQSTDINIRQTPEKLLISIEDENFRKYKLQISDIMGNIVLEQELNSGIGTLFMPVDITSLTNGAYLFMISTGGIIAKTGKIIIVN